MDERLLTAAELADWLKVAPDTVRKWRAIGTGPPYIQVEGQFRYPLTEAMTWLGDDQQPPPPEPELELVTEPEPVPADWVTPSTDLAQEALQEAAREAQQRAQEAHRPRDATNPVEAAQVAAVAAVRAVLGVDPDPGFHAIAHGGRVAELEMTVQGLRIVWDHISRGLFYLSQPDLNRYLIRNRADLGRAIAEEKRLNGDFLPPVSGDATGAFLANRVGI
jgi:hypothetical protein